MLQNEVELHHFDLCLFDSKSRGGKKKKKKMDAFPLSKHQNLMN